MKATKRFSPPKHQVIVFQDRAMDQIDVNNLFPREQTN